MVSVYQTAAGHSLRKELSLQLSVGFLCEYAIPYFGVFARRVRSACRRHIHRGFVGLSLKMCAKYEQESQRGE